MMVVGLISVSDMLLPLGKRGHSEIRNCIGDLASHVWPQSSRSTGIVNEATVSSGGAGLRFDLGIIHTYMYSMIK